MRRVLLLVVLLALPACGPEDALGRLHHSPAFSATDAGFFPLPDAGTAAIVDAGEDVVTACVAVAGDLDHCELADGGAGSARKGAVCGEACTGLCTEGRCRTGATWNTAVCGPGSTWTWNGACDDGNPCTSGDHCASGACAGAVDDSASCDDGDICTVGDHCTSGACVPGARNTAVIDRYYIGGTSKTYGYDGPGSGTFAGSWSDQGAIYRSAPGGQPIYILFSNTNTDRLLSLATSESSYGSPAQVGHGYSSHEPGTVPLERYSYTCSGGGNECNGWPRHFFTTSGHGGPPGGASSENSGIFVCPAP